MQVSIYEDNAETLILSQTLPSQYIPQSKQYSIKPIWFHKEIVKRDIKLVKIETIEHLGGTKALPREILNILDWN